MRDETYRIWDTWTTANSTSYYVWPKWMDAQTTRATRAVRQHHQAEVRFMNETRQAAYDRAKALLFACLSTTQRAQLERQGFFEVTAQSGNVYQIFWGQAGNVRREDGGQAFKYCCHPRLHEVPDPDAMLSQKFMLETDEAQFLRTANVTQVAARMAA